EGIHNDGPTATFGYSFGIPNTLTVNVNASASVCPDTCDSYAWDWGDGSPRGSGVTASHTYATAGTRPIKLTVTDGASKGPITKTGTATAPDLPPTIGGSCSTNADTWVMTVTDTSSDDVGIKQVTVNWGDGTALSNDTSAPFGPLTHKFLNAGSYTA